LKEIEHLNGLLTTDGTNSGIPTSKTPVNNQKLYRTAVKRPERIAAVREDILKRDWSVSKMMRSFGIL
jgi:hypothetical protein